MPTEIGDYLDAIENPDGLKDMDAIAKVKDELSADDLPARARLALMMQLRSLEDVDIQPLEDAFVKAVPKYLKDLGFDINDVREDFLTVGVDAEVLDRITATAVRRRSSGGAVSADDVRTAVLARASEFTQQDIIEVTNASRNTVSKVVNALAKEGKLKDKGGRPKVYARK